LKKATCYCCGKKGHYSNKCPEKDKCSKDEWAVKKPMMHAQAESEKETEEKDDNDNASQASRRSNKSNKQREWNNLVIKKESLHNNGKQWASNTKEDSILLDNGSTMSLQWLYSREIVSRHMRQPWKTIAPIQMTNPLWYQ
jgi:hypothetical protein